MKNLLAFFPRQATAGQKKLCAAVYNALHCRRLIRYWIQRANDELQVFTVVLWIVALSQIHAKRNAFRDFSFMK